MAGTAETTDVGGNAIGPRSTALSISNAISALHKRFVGRGPRNTITTVKSDLVVSVLEGWLTIAEETLSEHDRPDLVAAQRAGLQASMRAAMVAAVEDITGRRVASYMSATDRDLKHRAEIFVLLPDGSTGACP